jgi:hypothetical protein
LTFAALRSTVPAQHNRKNVLSEQRHPLKVPMNFWRKKKNEQEAMGDFCSCGYARGNGRMDHAGERAR